MNSLRKQIEDHRVEVAKEYATQSVVLQVEHRLTESINHMSEQLTGSITNLTNRFEEMFTRVLVMAASAKAMASPVPDLKSLTGER